MQLRQIRNLKFFLGIRDTSGKRCSFILSTTLRPNKCNPMIVLVLQTSISTILKGMIAIHARSQTSIEIMRLQWADYPSCCRNFGRWCQGPWVQFSRVIPAHPMPSKPFQSPACASLRPQPLAHWKPCAPSRAKMSPRRKKGLTKIVRGICNGLFRNMASHFQSQFGQWNMIAMVTLLIYDWLLITSGHRTGCNIGLIVVQNFCVVRMPPMLKTFKPSGSFMKLNIHSTKSFRATGIAFQG